MNDPATLRRRGIFRLTILALALVAVCFVISFLTARWVMEERQWQHDEPQGHQWLQEALNLSNSEMEAINAFEADYRSQHRELMEEFNSRIQQLAGLLRTTDTYTEEVTHAIHHLHEVHGDIQMLSIEHYYEMLNVLPPEKQQALRDLAVNALSVPE